MSLEPCLAEESCERPCVDAPYITVLQADACCSVGLGTRDPYSSFLQIVHVHGYPCDEDRIAKSAWHLGISVKSPESVVQYSTVYMYVHMYVCITKSLQHHNMSTARRHVISISNSKVSTASLPLVTRHQGYRSYRTEPFHSLGI